ncbi:MAG: chemotaxis-specific protein-glutamate methyltransferase CheB [Candidatus Riflebacteria bacterium]|nr:chemotaxis-specific protein-glutamate methyltransferase CheB [Candidatus Riflebacteria bacterium]
MNSLLIRTMVVDSSLVFRKIISDLLLEIEGIELVGQAPNGKIAIQKAQNLKPDLMILDMNLPEMSGLEVIRQIRELQIGCRVIVVSSPSPNMSLLGMKALSAGAFEFVLKPVAETIEDTRLRLAPEFKLAIQAFMESLRIRRTMDISNTTESGSAEVGRIAMATAVKIPSAAATMKNTSARNIELIVIGISTGGPPALAEVFSSIKEPLKVPVVIVQHIPPIFSEALAASIRERSGLWVEEIKDGMILESGHIYLAPGGEHVRLARGSAVNSYVLRLSKDSPENNCRPSIDYLLRSVVTNFAGRVGFLVMTGMGSDGLGGGRMIKAAGGYIIAQDAQSCVVYGMPRVIVEAGLADEILPLSAIAEGIQRLSRNAV